MADIFVFGSNRAGRHGKGAAKYALDNCGAILGVGEGLVGASYAIPTKDALIKTLQLKDIERHIWLFILSAAQRPDLRFFVSEIGCGLAGYTAKEIAPMFIGATQISNVYLPKAFCKELNWFDRISFDENGTKVS